MPESRPSVADKRRNFQQMHRGGCFVIPNPWDVGSALYLQSLGFKALASTSSGFAWSRGCADGAISRDQVLAHLHELVEATDVPVNADFQGGFAHTPSGVAESVGLAVRAGIAGLSIEDSTGESSKPLFDLDTAVARMRAARGAIDQAGGDTVLVARAECFLVGRPDIEETIGRLQAYADAGADCLFAPGIQTREHISALVTRLAPKPVNLLMGSARGMTVDEIAGLGVRRISVGGALARAAWGGFMRAAQLIADHGRFDSFVDAISGDALDSFFTRRPPKPGPAGAA